MLVNSIEFKSSLKQNPTVTNSMDPAEIYRFECNQKLITHEDLARGISADELLNRVRPRIKVFFEK